MRSTRLSYRLLRALKAWQEVESVSRSDRPPGHFPGTGGEPFFTYSKFDPLALTNAECQREPQSQNFRGGAL